MSLLKKYKLQGHEAVECAELLEWARWFETADRQVAEDFIDDPEAGQTLRVSTVFLGLDYRFGGKGPPLIFETMAFGPKEEMIDLRGRIRTVSIVLPFQLRYSTLDEAVIGHVQICNDVRETIADRQREIAAAVAKAKEPHD